MKVAIYTLGCKVNQYETQAMEQTLRAKGHQVVEFSDEADAYVVNTCSVTAVSDQKSRQVIHRVQKQHPAAVAEEMHRSYLEGCVGRTYPVLFEQPKNGKFFGHAPNYMEVLVDGAELHNALRTVRITDVDGEALLGEIVEQEAET